MLWILQLSYEKPTSSCTELNRFSTPSMFDKNIGQPWSQPNLNPQLKLDAKLAYFFDHKSTTINLPLLWSEGQDNLKINENDTT